jgi:beta-glucanase (GH16 family)
MFKTLAVFSSLLTASLVSGESLLRSRSLQGTWYELDYSQGQTPANFMDLGGNKFTMKVAPSQEAVKVHSTQYYTGGRFEVKVKSASAMPGVITAVYLASGNGRTSDQALGNQDELDIEFKGNEPTSIQTNIFTDGAENLQVVNVGADTSATEHTYGIEWNDNTVSFSVDGAVVRTQGLYRPLQPMKLSFSVWTTMGGWPGLIQWGGATDWSTRNFAPIEATFEIVSFPN